jgi:hypothetical protein
MGTDYKVFEDENILIQLYEMSTRFYLMVDLKKSVDNEDGTYSGESVRKLTVDELIDVAVNLLGPMHYQDPGPRILEVLTQKLKDRGYT